MSNVDIAGRITELRTELSKTTVSPEDVLNELKKIGFSNIQSFISGDNEICDISQLPPEVAAAVELIQSDIRHDSEDSEGYTEKVKIKLCSKLSALEKIGNTLGMFIKKIEHSGKNGEPIEFAVTITKTYKENSAN